jgi:hypothetical protein
MLRYIPILPLYELHNDTHFPNLFLCYFHHGLHTIHFVYCSSGWPALTDINHGNSPIRAPDFLERVSKNWEILLQGNVTVLLEQRY